MSVSNKTRKILWGRSGNRCAICRQELVVEATSADKDAVVGDECHIISGRPSGPRHDRTFPHQHLDETENLILLCRVHHKMVDDQHETYTADVLRSLKVNHEKWVSAALKEQEVIPPVRITRVKENAPEHLVRLTSGRAVLAVVDSAYAYAFDHDDLTSEEEVDLVSSFLQEAQDYGDLAQDFEAGGRVRVASDLSTRITELEEAGFWVFGAREVRRIEGGVEPPSSWPVAILHVIRSTNPKIIAGSPERRTT